MIYKQILVFDSFAANNKDKIQFFKINIRYLINIYKIALTHFDSLIENFDTR